jgi:hypothetical protein
VTGYTSGNLPRPARNTRHAVPTFEGRALAGAEGTGQAGVIAIGLPGPVVGGKDYQGVVIYIVIL